MRGHTGAEDHDTTSRALNMKLGAASRIRWIRGKESEAEALDG